MKHFIVSVFKTLLLLVIVCIIVLSVRNLVMISRGDIIPMTFNFGIATVDTGSMEPNIHAGSVILLRKVDSYSPGDIITYINNENIPITHRVMSINDGMVTAKGDANVSSDKPFSENSIVGRVDLVIPYVGYFVKALQSSFAYIAIVILLVIVFIYDVIGLDFIVIRRVRMSEDELRKRLYDVVNYASIDEKARIDKNKQV